MTARKSRKNTTPSPVPTGLWIVTRRVNGLTETIGTPHHSKYDAQRLCTLATMAYTSSGWRLTSFNLDVSVLKLGDAVEVLKVEPEMMG